jgi:hypothetical protein
MPLRWIWPPRRYRLSGRRLGRRTSAMWTNEARAMDGGVQFDPADWPVAIPFAAAGAAG